MKIAGQLHWKCIHRKEAYTYIRKGGTRGSGTAVEPLRPMASKLFAKKVCAVRFRLRSAAALATSAEREVPRANGRLLPGVQPIFYVTPYFLETIVFQCSCPDINKRTVWHSLQMKR